MLAPLRRAQVFVCLKADSRSLTGYKQGLSCERIDSTIAWINHLDTNHRITQSVLVVRIVMIYSLETIMQHLKN